MVIWAAWWGTFLEVLLRGEAFTRRQGQISPTGCKESQNLSIHRPLAPSIFFILLLLFPQWICFFGQRVLPWCPPVPIIGLKRYAKGLTGSQKQLLSFDRAAEEEKAQESSFAKRVVSVALSFSNLLQSPVLNFLKEANRCSTVKGAVCCGYSWGNHMTHLYKLIKVFSFSCNVAISVN